MTQRRRGLIGLSIAAITTLCLILLPFASAGALAPDRGPAEGGTVVELDAPKRFNMSSIAAGSSATYALGEADSVPVLYAWGGNSSGELGMGASVNTVPTPTLVELPTGFTPGEIHSAWNHVLLLGTDADGTPMLLAWGYNAAGQLGDGQTGTNSFTPISIALPAGFTPTQLASGENHSLVLGTDAAGQPELLAWGSSYQGQLGQGSNASSLTPIPIPLAADFTPAKIAAGSYSSYVLGTGDDGSTRLYAWGSNYAGQLGIGSSGTAANRNSPVQVTGFPSGVVLSDITGGFNHTFALGTDNSGAPALFAWGSGYYGQLGNGTSGNGTNQTTPIRVDLPAGFTPSKISGTRDHALMLGLEADGTEAVYSWGANGSGQIGNGTSGSSATQTTPIRVGLPAGFRAMDIATGGVSSHVVGLDADHESAVYGWGGNYMGQLGDGTVDQGPSRHIPLLIPRVEVTSVLFGDTPAASFSHSPGANTLSAVSPPGTAGSTVDIVIEWELNGASQASLLLAEAYRYESAVVPGGGRPDQASGPGRAEGTSSASPQDAEPLALPSIRQHPASQTAAAGSDVVFTVASDDSPSPEVQWQHSADRGGTWIELDGQTAWQLALTAEHALDGAHYRAVLSNPAGGVASKTAVLTVTEASVPAPAEPGQGAPPAAEDESDAMAWLWWAAGGAVLLLMIMTMVFIRRRRD